MKFSIFTIYRPFVQHFRGKRHERFLREVQPKRSDRVLDIGGYAAFWKNWPSFAAEIDCLNLHAQDYAHEGDPQPVRILVGDGCQLSFPDRSYDIAFSNSVIEHVGSWQRQQAFAAEIRRVGKCLWVQTPAYECPVEPHFLAPFVHFVPKSIRPWFVRWFTPWSWIQKPSDAQIHEMVETTRLLSRREMKELFPDCRLLTERLWGVFPKSYVAVRR